jgi:Domain of unknown function (DUF4279)
MHPYTVELRIVGSNLDPEQVTADLGILPTQVRRKGEARSKTSNWPTTMWGIEVLPPGQDDWSSLEDGLNALLSVVAPVQSRIRRYSTANEVFLWCGHFTSSFDGGPVLTPNLLRSLAEMGVQLVLDTYRENDLEVEESDGTV